MESLSTKAGRMHPKVVIVILNWNGSGDTIACIDSLRRIDYPHYEVVLVDNRSRDADISLLKERCGDFLSEIIINDKNFGFAGGNNRGIAAALARGADFVLLLNNDTIVEPDFLTNLVAKRNVSEKIGVLTPKIMYASQRDVIWSAGGYISALRASGFSYGLNAPATSFIHDRYCTFASGCCLLISREVVEKVGLLDEQYFLYLEDVDYCHRIVHAGYKIFYVASSRIFHKVSAASGRRDERLLPWYYTTRNRLIFAKKRLGGMYYLSVPFILIRFFFKLAVMGLRDKARRDAVVAAFKDYFLGKTGETERRFEER